jgi:glycosyltransferase involved in cell wall biosynthesis
MAIARTNSWKGFYTFIKAMDEIYRKRKDFEIRIVNSDNISSGDLGFKYITLTERVPSEEFVKKTKEILCDVDVVIVPCLTIETGSMLSGRPVPATKGNGGLVEQVTDGVDGFHVNTYEVKEFANTLYKILLIFQTEIKENGRKSQIKCLAKV